jgi:transcriptional regulator with XRE-family HTH domain
VLQRVSKPISLGRQLREARLRARVKPKDLARRAGLSTAAVYNCERYDRGGRTQTLQRLAGALGLTLRIPDLVELCTAAGLTASMLADMSGLSFDTVRSLLARADKGNVRTLEAVARALDAPLVLVV